MDRNSYEFVKALNIVLSEVKKVDDFTFEDDSQQKNTDGDRNYFVRIKINKKVKYLLTMEIVICSDGKIRFDLPKEMKEFIEIWDEQFKENVNINKFYEIKNGFKKGVERGIFSGTCEDFPVTFNLLYGLMTVLASK